MVATVAALHLDAPVIVSAPGGRSKRWTGKSDTLNRPLRVSVDLDPQSGQISGRQNFSDRHWIGRAVAYGIAAHEGQLFGWANVALKLLTGVSLILLSVSGVIMWWKRRDTGVLGTPKASLSRSSPAACWASSCCWDCAFRCLSHLCPWC